MSTHEVDMTRTLKTPLTIGFFSLVFALPLSGCQGPQTRGDNPAIAQANALGHTGGRTDHSKQLAMTPISWLVTFNRLHTAADLQDALNKKPGQFSKVDVDGDGKFDAMTVVKRDRPGGHAFELQGAGGKAVATLLFDAEWQPVGSINGAMANVAPSQPATPPTLAPSPTAKPAPTPAPSSGQVAANPGTPTPTPAAATPAGAASPAPGSEAATLLASARKSLAAGQAKQAYLQASQSFHKTNSDDALEIMAKTACTLGTLEKAKWAAGRLKGTRKAGVVTACKSAGVTLE